MYSALRRSICSPSVAVPSNVMRGDRLPDAVRACVCLLLLIFLHKFLSVTCVLTGAYEGSQFHNTTAHVPRTLCESVGEFQRVQWRATGHALLWRKHCFVRVRHHLKVFKKKKSKIPVSHSSFKKTSSVVLMLPKNSPPHLFLLFMKQQPPFRPYVPAEAFSLRHTRTSALIFMSLCSHCVHMLSLVSRCCSAAHKLAFSPPPRRQDLSSHPSHRASP